MARPRSRHPPPAGGGPPELGAALLLALAAFLALCGAAAALKALTPLPGEAEAALSWLVALAAALLALTGVACVWRLIGQLER